MLDICEEMCYPNWDRELINSRKTFEDCGHHKGGIPNKELSNPYDGKSFIHIRPKAHQVFSSRVTGEIERPKFASETNGETLNDIPSEKSPVRSETNHKTLTSDTLSTKTNDSAKEFSHRYGESHIEYNVPVKIRFTSLPKLNIEQFEVRTPPFRKPDKLNCKPKVKLVYSETLNRPNQVSTNYFEKFCNFLKIQESNSAKPLKSESELYAKKSYINPESKELAVGDSHVTRLISNLEERKCSFLAYPGSELSKDSDF